MFYKSTVTSLLIQIECLQYDAFINDTMDTHVCLLWYSNVYIYVNKPFMYLVLGIDYKWYFIGSTNNYLSYSRAFPLKSWFMAIYFIDLFLMKCSFIDCLIYPMVNCEQPYWIVSWNISNLLIYYENFQYVPL